MCKALFIYTVKHTQCSSKIHRKAKYSSRASKESFISGKAGTASLEPAAKCPALPTLRPPAAQNMLEQRMRAACSICSSPYFQGGLHKWPPLYAGSKDRFEQSSTRLKILFEIDFNEKYSFFFLSNSREPFLSRRKKKWVHCENRRNYTD